MKFKFFIFQILTEQVCTQVVHKPHPEPDSTVKIQNPSEQTAILYCNAVVTCNMVTCENKSKLLLTTSVSMAFT